MPSVDCLCRERFPGLNNSVEQESIHLLDQSVDVVRHDDPSKQPIPLAVKMCEGIAHNGRISRIAQYAGAATPIDQFFQPQISVLWIYGGYRSFFVNRSRKTVGEPKCDHLRDGAAIKMRKIAALVPTSRRAGRP